MKNWFLTTILVLLAGLTSCKDDEYSDDCNTYPRPEWKTIEVSGDNVYTMTAVYALPSNISAYQTEDDIMGAFVGEECRATAKPTNGVFMLNIIGRADETSKVTIRYWNAERQYLYESSAAIDFVPDMIFGVVDEPKIFNGDIK